MRILVLGAGGLLGRALVAAARADGLDVAGASHAECDIAWRDSLLDLARTTVPAVIFNPASYTDVDGCERDPVRACAANALGARNAAFAARALGARLIHVSTDYVFSGRDRVGDRSPAPYTELDLPDPISVYARSKLLGEQYVRESGADALVVRTAWIFGPGGKNFVTQIPAILRERGTVQAIDDQVSTPTYAPDLAAKLLDLAWHAPPGLYHVANEGHATYHEVARLAAALLLGRPEAARPIRTADLPARAALRPSFSALASVALPAEGIEGLRPWKEAFSEYVRSLAG